MGYGEEVGGCGEGVFLEMFEPLGEGEVEDGFLPHRQDVEDDENGSSEFAVHHDFSVQHSPRLDSSHYVLEGLGEAGVGLESLGGTIDQDGCGLCEDQKITHSIGFFR